MRWVTRFVVTVVAGALRCSTLASSQEAVTRLPACEVNSVVAAVHALRSSGEERAFTSSSVRP